MLDDLQVLLAAGEGALRLLYDAMMADLRAGRVPDEWRQVLYALLVKPAPKNPERVCERREIALMSQTQKLLLVNSAKGQRYRRSDSVNLVKYQM